MPDEYDPLIPTVNEVITSEKRDIPQSERDKMPAAEFAGPHQSFPIAKPEDIASAAHLIGKADDPEAVKARIIAIAKKHGWEKYLPAAWDAGEEGSEKPGAPDEAEKALYERVWDAIQTRLGRKEVSDDPLSSFKVFTDKSGQARWLALYSNNFEDRDHEFFSEKGFDRYVKRLDMGLVAMPKLRTWHVAGTEYGVADWVDRIGHFHVASGTYDDTEMGRAGKAYDQAHASEYGVSHGLLHRRSDKEVVNGKNVFKDWITFEISPLPHHKAANDLTAFAVEKDSALKEAKMDTEKRKHLVEKYGEDAVVRIETATEQRGKEIEEYRAYKEFVNPDGDAEVNVNKEALNVAEKAFGEFIPQLVEDVGLAVSVATQSDKVIASVKSDVASAVKSLDEKYADAMKQIDALREEIGARPRESARAASKSASTVIGDDHPLLKQSQLGTDESLKEALPGLFRS